MNYGIVLRIREKKKEKVREEISVGLKLISSSTVNLDYDKNPTTL